MMTLGRHVANVNVDGSNPFTRFFFHALHEAGPRLPGAGG